VGGGGNAKLSSSNGPLVAMEQWSGPERAVAVSAYYRNGDSVITAQRVFGATMRFRPAVKFLLHTQYARGFVTLKRLVGL
jgi:hypothetical protein